MKVTYKVQHPNEVNRREITFADLCDYVKLYAQSSVLSRSEIVVALNGKAQLLTSVEDYCQNLPDLQKLLLQVRGQCCFDRDWMGPCKAAIVAGSLYCIKHHNQRCVSCMQQATHSCDITIGAFVCGMYLCDNCNGEAYGYSCQHSKREGLTITA